MWEEVLTEFAGCEDIDMAYPTTRYFHNVEEGKTPWQPDFDAFTSLKSERDGDEIRIAVGLAPGTYVVMVGMFFETGDVQYGVVLEVQ